MKNDHSITLSDNRILGYAEYGDPSGQPLFFFHGWPNSRLYGQILDACGQKLQIRIISVDRPGYGLSEHKHARTLLTFADDIRELADTLKLDKFALLGNSGGGPYATACAYMLPERVTKVGITVGLGPTFLPEMLKGLPLLSNLGWRYYSVFPPLATFATRLLKVKADYFSSFHFLDFYSPADMKVFKTFSKDTLKQRRKEAFRQGIKGPALDLILYSKEWGFLLEKITAPVFLWYGEEDKKVSVKMGEYYASHIPNSKLTIYPGEGHMIINVHTEEILKTLL